VPAGCLNKQAAPEELARGVKKVADVGTHANAKVGEKLASQGSKIPISWFTTILDVMQTLIVGVVPD